MRVRSKRLLRIAAVVVALLMVTDDAAYGQVSSRINGLVSDATGGVVPGTKVTATEVNRGTMQTTVTNEAGRYSFPNLQVGDYVVSAELAGFKKATTAKIKLDVNQTVEVNIKLEVGAVNQQVEVTGAAPLLQTSDSQVGGVVENKQVVELPLAARDFMQLTLLSAGVVESNDNTRHQTERATWQGSFSVHGQRAKYNQYLFDGMSGKEYQHETNIFAPSIDAIQEMKVETSNYDAEFGGEAGGHINIVTKAGTNNIHGTVFEFLRNDKLDARERFADSKSELRRNTFGATAGGPIRKDRTFWFGSWQSMRLRQGFTQNTTVPTKAFRDGDFSSLLQTDFSNRTPIKIYDWQTKQPFANNIVPKGRMHPLPMKFLDQFIPLPNRAGRGGIRPIDNFQSLAPQRTRTDEFMTRFDHVFNQNSRLFARYAFSDTDTLGPPVWPAFSYSHLLRGQHAVLNWSRTLTAARIFEFRAGYSRFKQTEVTESAFKRDVSQELGLKGTCRQPACWHAPFFSVTDFSPFGNPSGKTQGQGVSGPRGWTNEIFEIDPRMYWIHGKHSLKFGFSGRRYHDTFPEAIRPAGQHFFDGQWTAGADSTGFALADTLMGLPRQIQASIDIFDPNYRNSHVMPWFQDNWKVTPKLTLNLGMRYEWFGRPFAKRDNISNFLPAGAGKIITPQDTGGGAPFQRRPDNVGRGLLQNDNNNFAPRVGFAYHADDKTVVRGAYGVFYQRDSACTWILMSINPPFIRTGDVRLNVNPQSIRDFPVDDLTPVVNFVTPGSRPALFAINIDLHDAYVQQWNLYVERSVSQNMVLKAGYVGNHSVGLRRFLFPNSPRPAAGDIQARRPFQDIGSVRTATSDGQSTYNGFELELEKRYSKGLSFITAYTASKTLDNMAPLDLWFGGSNKGISDLHIGHRFSFASVWEVPYGRGRSFGAQIPAIADAFLGGWQLSGILTLRTGFALTVTTKGNIANTDGITQVANRIRDPNFSKSSRTWDRFFDFDTGAFTSPDRFTLGNAGVGSIDGPGFRNLDLSVSKLFRFRESRLLQFRAEFFNISNHPNMGFPGTVFETASFGRVNSTSGTPRDVQLGLKFLF